jgi:signal transduction histidine kinase
MAASAYTALLRSPDPDIRAGALLRLGSIHTRARRWDAALDAYRQAADLAGAQAAGAPADLQARRRMCLALERAGRTEALAIEAANLRADFERGRWALDRAAWELTAEDVERWTGSPVTRDPSKLLMSQVAERLSSEGYAGGGVRVTRKLFVVDDQPITVLARGDRAERRVLLMTPALLASVQQDAVVAAAGLTTGHVSLRGDLGGAFGVVMSGDAPDTLSLTSSDTGLPWTVMLGPEDAAVVSERLGQRRWLLVFGFSAVLVFVVGAGVFLWRLVRREAAVRRLEQEFISVVSHEFRTPLTSLRLAWEVLDDDSDAPAEQRRALYGSIGRNSERLQRLVESLLDFSRMESGRRPYQLVPTNVGALVQQVVADFRRQHAESGTDVRVSAPTDASCVVSADAAALGHALWNLLDNGLKYSPKGTPVEVVVEPDADVVRLSVTDRGLGVPKAEQAAIFERFVRGQRAQRDGVSGTGLGLAIVAHVIEAHQGSVSVLSDVDQGSTFTMTLPRSRSVEGPVVASLPA